MFFYLFIIILQVAGKFYCKITKTDIFSFSIRKISKIMYNDTNFESFFLVPKIKS